MPFQSVATPWISLPASHTAWNTIPISGFPAGGEMISAGIQVEGWDVGFNIVQLFVNTQNNMVTYQVFNESAVTNGNFAVWAVYSYNSGDDLSSVKFEDPNPNYKKIDKDTSSTEG